MGDDLNDYARARVGAAMTQKYRLERLIGCGGMAAVYEAVHRNGHRVAIKVLHPHLCIESDLRKRFLREGYVANKVKHPGAVRVADDDVTEDGSVFLVMELLEGETLDARWQRHGRRMPLREVCDLASQLLDVLAAAHAQGVVHRDIKPENLFVTSEGVLKVLDFGIARLRDASGPEGATRTGRMIGTPAFMPPEQVLGRSRQIDGQTDLWAVGATMFTLAAGQFVHEAETMEEMLVHAGSRPARPVSAVLPSAPPGVARVIDRALAFKREERWPSARAMHSALAQEYAATYGAALPGYRAPQVPDVDPYGLTAAASAGAASPVGNESPFGQPPRIEDAVAAEAVGSGGENAVNAGIAKATFGTAPLRTGKGVSTTAGLARSGPEHVGEATPTLGRSKRVVGAGIAAMVLGGACTAFIMLHPKAEERHDTAASGLVQWSSPSVVPSPAVEPAPISIAPAPSGGAQAIEGTDSSHPVSTAATRPAPIAPGPTHARRALDTTPTIRVPVPSPIAAAPPAPLQPAPPQVEPTPIEASAKRPACRVVPYFDSDGNKRFKQECR